MLYYLLRPITRIALKVYFRSITINGLEHFPDKGAVLISCNHPSAFIEPCLLACFLPRTLHFLVRGDLFFRPVLRLILISTNQIPIFRLKDGFSKLKYNEKHLNRSRDILLEGKAILIFSEASAAEVRHVRKVQKGISRLAFDALREKEDLELHIVPVGVNYLSPNHFRSEVIINIGNPIAPQLPDQEHVSREATKLTTAIEAEMGEMLMAQTEKEGILDHMIFMDYWQRRKPGRLRLLLDDNRIFTGQRKFSDKLSAGEVPAGTLSEIESIQETLDSKGLHPIHFRKPAKSNIRYLFSAILAIPVGIIVLLNGLPLALGNWMKNKYVWQQEFKASVLIGASLGFYVVIFFLLFIIFSIIYGWWSMFLFLVPLIGFICLPLMDYVYEGYMQWTIERIFGKTNANKIYQNAVEIIQKIK